jgi:enamine deaminase RidA (YjgF/YER057c/UK114 family)
VPLPQAIDVPGHHKPSSYFSHVVRHGDTLYLAGQGAMGPDGKLVGPGDIAKQAEQAFSNVKFILEALGGDLRHVIKITTFVVDARHHPIVMETRKRFFGDWAPASIFACINNLPQEGMLIAVDVVAAVPDAMLKDKQGDQS